MHAEALDTLIRAADLERQTTWVLLIYITIKLLWIILLLIEEAQYILGPRNCIEYIDHCYPERVLSNVSSLGDKACTGDKKTSMFKDILETQG